jgi:hypothetical protein
VKKTRVVRDSWIMGSRFKYLCSDVEKKVEPKVEDVVIMQRKNAIEEDILKEVKEWVEDPFYSRTR